MAAAYYIIDGYNLMHAAGFARPRYGPGDLERCRNRLLGYLKQRLSSEERDRATVVFDAGQSTGDGSRRIVSDGINILYSDPGSDADSLIESLVASHSSPRQIVVISADHRLQRAARRRRGDFMDSLDFFARLEARGPAPDSSDHPPATPREIETKRGETLTDAETRQWLEVFGQNPDDSGQSSSDALQKEIDAMVREAKRSNRRS